MYVAHLTMARGVVMNLNVLDLQLDASSDAALVAAGFATVTPLSSVRENPEIRLPNLRADDVTAQLRAGSGSA